MTRTLQGRTRTRDILWVALVACALAVPAAIADNAGPAGLKKDVKKALKTAKSAKKTAKQALNAAREPGPRGEKGAKGDPGEPGPQGVAGPAGVDAVAPIHRADSAPTVATTSAVPIDLGGPGVTFPVGPGGAFVQFAAKVELDTGVDATCQVHVASPSLPTTINTISQSNETGFNSFATNTQPVRFLPEGDHFFVLQYRRSAGTTNCQFRNRTIQVVVF